MADRIPLCEFLRRHSVKLTTPIRLATERGPIKAVLIGSCEHTIAGLAELAASQEKVVSWKGKLTDVSQAISAGQGAFTRPETAASIIRTYGASSVSAEEAWRALAAEREEQERAAAEREEQERAAAEREEQERVAAASLLAARGGVDPAVRESTDNGKPVSTKAGK